MKSFWEIEREADLLLKNAGFKTKRFGTTLRYNPNAPENRTEPMKGENNYTEAKSEFERQEMMKRQQIKQEIKQKKKTDEKLAV